MDVSNQPAVSSSAPKPVETTLKVKAKKRKSVVDFSVLAQRDIEGLMQKKQATQVPTQSMFQLHDFKRKLNNYRRHNLSGG
jgi:hypothetical protein